MVKGAKGAKAAVQRAAAAAQAPLHAVRGTGQQERMLKNARTEYQDEAEEIATYRAIEALAKAVGDKETAKLARDIGREEKRMADFLVGIIDQLALDVVHDEVPVSEIGAAPAARRTASRPRATTRAKATTSRAKATTRGPGQARARRSQPRRAPRPSRPALEGQPPRARVRGRRHSASAAEPRSSSAAPRAGSRAWPRRWSARRRRGRSGRRERARARLGDDVARAQLGAARRARQVAR